MLSRELPPYSNSAFRLLSGNLSLGCHSEDVCNDPANPCRNNGSCVDLFNDFECECKKGWHGNPELIVIGVKTLVFRIHR